MLWFQKSRIEAICDGDRNTRYFHLSTVIRRRKRNRIEALQKKEGQWVMDANQVKGMVLDYWKNLFQEESQSNHYGRILWDLVTISFCFAECEVLAALRSMKPFKAPGPDGFQPVFFQRYWDVVGPNVIKLVRVMCLKAETSRRV